MLLKSFVKSTVVVGLSLGLIVGAYRKSISVCTLFH